jgi:hypothetical protein
MWDAGLADGMAAERDGASDVGCGGIRPELTAAMLVAAEAEPLEEVHVVETTSVLRVTQQAAQDHQALASADVAGSPQVRVGEGGEEEEAMHVEDEDALTEALVAEAAGEMAHAPPARGPANGGEAGGAETGSLAVSAGGAGETSGAASGEGMDEGGGEVQVAEEDADVQGGDVQGGEEEASEAEAEEVENGPFRKHDAVKVRWGNGKKYAAVVTKPADESDKKDTVEVQYDAHPRAYSTMSLEKVKHMPAAKGLPRWMRKGSRLEALKPFAKGAVVWRSATVLKARQGPRKKPDDGLRLWVQFQPGGNCDWVQRGHVREVGASLAVSDTEAAAGAPNNVKRNRASGKAAVGAGAGEASAKRQRSGRAVGREQAAASAGAALVRPGLSVTSGQAPSLEASEALGGESAPNEGPQESLQPHGPLPSAMAVALQSAGAVARVHSALARPIVGEWSETELDPSETELDCSESELEDSKAKSDDTIDEPEYAGADEDAEGCSLAVSETVEPSSGEEMDEGGGYVPDAEEGGADVQGADLQGGEEEVSDAEVQQYGKFPKNDAVIVMWGPGRGKPWAAVLTNPEKLLVKENCVPVQFDEKNSDGTAPARRVKKSVATAPARRVKESVATASAGRVFHMPRAQGLPKWMSEGSRLEAVDPFAEDPEVYSPALVVEARQGPIILSEDDGLRFWVQYEDQPGGQWVKRQHVREVGSASASAATETAPGAPSQVKRGRATSKAAVGVQGGAPAKRRRGVGAVERDQAAAPAGATRVQSAPVAARGARGQAPSVDASEALGGQEASKDGRGDSN